MVTLIIKRRAQVYKHEVNIMSSYLDFEGMYDPSKRFVVYNWSPEDFVQHFNEESMYNDVNVIVTKPAYDIRIKAGQMRELTHFESFIITKNFVNREMLRQAEGKDIKEREKIEMSMNNKDARKPFEDKTIQPVEAGTESLFMKEMRESIRQEELAKIKAETAPVAPVVDIPEVEAVNIPSAPAAEFSE